MPKLSALFLIVIAAFPRLAYTEEVDKCENNVETLKGISVTVSNTPKCTIITCSEVNSKNIEAALAKCHQTEKDHNYCGWYEKATVSEAKIILIENGKYNVAITSCNT